MASAFSNITILGVAASSPPSRREAISAMHTWQEDTYGLAGWRRDAASPRARQILDGGDTCLRHVPTSRGGGGDAASLTMMVEAIGVVAEKRSEATRLSGSLGFVGRMDAYDFFSEVYVASANQVGCAIIDYFK